jgi:hypothetical protein
MLRPEMGEDDTKLYAMLLEQCVRQDLEVSHNKFQEWLESTPDSFLLSGTDYPVDFTILLFNQFLQHSVSGTTSIRLDNRRLPRKSAHSNLR